jgi:hypothetical protein
MRTHFLNKLEIAGKEKVLHVVDNFDLYTLHRIVSFTWESQRAEICDKLTANLTMKAECDSGPLEKAEITLRFIDVASCKMPELTPLVFLGELEVEDARDSQLEGVGYIVKNYGSTELEINCRTFQIADFTFGRRGAD